MNCPHCGEAYEQIFAMGQVAPVAEVPACSCPTSYNGNVASGSYWIAPQQYSSTTAGLIPPPSPPAPPAPPAPLPPLRPAGEIVNDLRDLLDELDDG